MHPYDNHLPRRVCFGRGSVGKIPELAKSLVAASAPFTLGMNPSIHPTSGSQPRVFVVTDPGVRQAGLVEPLLEQLKDRGLLCGCYDRVSLEPPLEMVDELAVELRDSDAQVIVGLGGGSVMDATKVAGVVARVANGLRSSDSSAQRLGSARDYVGIGKVPARGLPTILVPTTAGTGSEATFVAILTDKATGNKVGVVSPYLLPDIAVVDPELTDRLPPTITAATGMDAIVHALEATIAKVATPLAQGLAWRAARELGGAIERVVEHPDDRAARDAMALGSHLAGMAFANSSCCAVHALALPLGGRYPIPHGVITGCFCGEVMRWNAQVCAPELTSFAEALGWGSLSAPQFCDQLDRLAARIGLLDQLRSVPVRLGSVQEMARDAVANRRLMDPNPLNLGESDVVTIYKNVLQL